MKYIIGFLTISLTITSYYTSKMYNYNKKLNIYLSYKDVENECYENAIISNYRRIDNLSNKKLNELLWEIQLMEELILSNKLPKSVEKLFWKQIKEINKILDKMEKVLNAKP